MSKVGISLVLTFLFLIGVWVFLFKQDSQPPKQVQVGLSDTQSSNLGDVVVEVAPVSFGNETETAFTVLFDTHSVELDYDLMKVSQLSDDKGNISKPISWSGGKGGHHLKGQLVFPPLSKKAKSAELFIAQISGFDRKFQWSLN